MAEYVAIPVDVKLPACRRVFMARTSHLPLRRCYGLSAVANANGASIAEWVPYVDQVLILASITLTYMAGVISMEKSQYNAKKSIPLIDVIPGNSSPGSAVSSDDEVPLQFAWDVVSGKLIEALSAIEKGENFVDRIGELEQNSTKQASSLSAIAEGPRIRLLCASLKWLNKEIANTASAETNSANDLLSVFAKIIENCCQPLCMAWLEEELCVISRKHDKACNICSNIGSKYTLKEFFSLAEKKLTGYDNITQNIRKSGKEYLYAELVYALGFGSTRKGGYYNGSLFIQNGVAILEDLLITLADGIASMYLELISVDSSLCNEMNNLGLSLCTLSTRALQRLRNEA
ncbi:mediator of RNA polymerase II transcription subunit [Striga asiatica]|uniref:Mediator of RNA polymerase II transcription subunit n=1 Tax=Striga asiatica TaxID=4170 RepID=A0A5A7QM64_STRAF|nr:mediator of RNA polymerase II transcription subunit [Striga asiatica]